MVINLYPPEIHSPGQELAPSQSEGCQRVIEPDLSPLLYKSKPVLEVLIERYCYQILLRR